MRTIELTERLQKAKDEKLLAFHCHLIQQQENKFEGYDILLEAVENEILQRDLLNCNDWDKVQLSKDFGLSKVN